jgi:hypothetical protein
MKTFILTICFVCITYLLHAQQVYFSKDYNFPTKQAWAKNVFTTQQGYITIGGYAHDINIQGNYRKNQVIVFSSHTITGDTLYTKRYNSPIYGWVAYSGIKTFEGDYISTGWKNLDTINYTQDSTVAFLIIFDENGDTLWTKEYMYSPQKRSYGTAIYQEADSGFVICGVTNIYSTKFRAMVLRLDKDGNVLWEKTYPNAGDVYAYSIAKSPDGGYLLGCTQWGGGTSGMSDWHIIKVDSLGNFMWSKLYGGNDYDWGVGITNCPDGGYILSGDGKINTNQQWPDGAIRRIDMNGNLIWAKYIGNENNNAFDTRVYALFDGHYITLGASRDSINVNAVNAWLVKFDIEGNIIWQRFFNKYGGNNHNYFRDLKETPDKGFVIVGELTNLSLWQQNLWLIKLDSMGCEIPNCAVSISEDATLQAPVFNIYPNPAQDVLYIETTLPNSTLVMYDITGKEMLQTSITEHTQQLDISILPKGLYLCSLLQGGKRYHAKVIKE